MIGSRLRHSLAQVLEFQDPAVCVAMPSKYGASKYRGICA